jgi:16S rRNA processing protein RimM
LKNHKDLVSFGRITRSQGRRGEVRIQPDFQLNDTSFFFRVYIDLKGRREALEVESHRFFKSAVIVKLKGIDSIAEAESLVGLEVYAAEEELPALKNGRYYAFHLAGFRMETRSGETVGTIRDAVQAPGNDLLVVEREGREMLVPFVWSICVDIRMADKTVVVDLPDGLLDLNEI